MKHFAAQLLRWWANHIDPPIRFGDIRMAQRRYIAATEDLVRASRERAGTHRQYYTDGREA